ncbi:MAG: AAA family ATPase, partial [Planctomycetes bacterium]|nr:AAA family ATPase [Planctomycetota bacterium]
VTGASEPGPGRVDLRPGFCSKSQWKDLVDSIALDSVADGRRPLNLEQDIVFHLFAQQVWKEAVGHKKPRQSMCMIVRGTAGTGKSRLIDAIKQLVECAGCPELIWTGAYNGIAASLIGGPMLVKTLGLARTKLGPEAQCELLQRFEGLRYLIIDDVSMISTQMLFKLDRQLR